MTVPKGQPLPLPTFTCHYNDPTAGDVTETIQFARFTIDGDDPTPAATADHFSALTFATPLDRTITLEANFTQTAAKPPPGRAAKFTVYHQDIYAPLNLVPGGPPTDEGPVTTNSGGTVAVRFTNRRQIPSLFYELSDDNKYLINRVGIQFATQPQPPGFNLFTAEFQIRLTANYAFTSAAKPVVIKPSVVFPRDSSAAPFDIELDGLSSPNITAVQFGTLPPAEVVSSAAGKIVGSDCG